MKIRVFLFFLLTVIVEAADAQILIGPTAGVNYSWISFGDKDKKDIYRVKPVLGYHAGFNLSFKVQKRFFLHSSFIYSTKGKIIEGKEGSDKQLKFTARYNYIELPIMYTVEFKRALKAGKEFKWYFGFGPNVSYWLGGKGTFFNSEIAEQIPANEMRYRIAFNKSEEELAPNEVGVQKPNRIQLGLNLSAGLVFEPLPHRQFMLTARYEFGHSYLSRTSEGIIRESVLYRDDLQTRNRGFRVSLAYLIDLRTDQRKRGKSTFKIRK